MATHWTRNAANTGWLNGQSVTGFKQRAADNGSWINDTGSLAKTDVRNAGNTAWIGFSGGGGGTTYSISPSTTTVSEGGMVSYTVSVSGGFTGTLYWTNSGTANGADFSGGLSSGSISVTGGAGTLALVIASDGVAEGAETIILQLRTGSTAGTVVATAATVTISGSSASTTTIQLLRNDLEFIYMPTITSPASNYYVRLQATLDISNYFNYATNSVDHIGFVLDAAGDSSVYAPDGTRDHCGQIARYGQPLWDVGRGFILFRSGSMWSEHWYQGRPAGTPGFGHTDWGWCLNPLTNPIITIVADIGYRDGSKGNSMELWVYAGAGTGGALLTNLYEPWGWDWTGNHRLAFFGIASGHRDPSSDGCVETSAAGPAYNARYVISNYSLTAIAG